MNTLLPPPKLSRSYATTGFDTYLARTPREAERLQRQVLTAYANLPFKGQPLIIPGDIVVSNDLWRNKLEDHLQLLCEQGLDHLKEFSLEAWLMKKVEDEGTQEQREELRALQERLDAEDARFAQQQMAYEIIDDAFQHSGLPSDIMSVVHQPLTEVEVYRDLSDIAVDAAQPPADDDNDDDECDKEPSEQTA